MTPRPATPISTRRPRRSAFFLLLITIIAAGGSAQIQSASRERSFPQSRTAVEKALKQLQAAVAGRLPVLEGFVVPDARALDRFQRGYYQCSVAVSPTPSGGSLVRVNAKVTAWYADPVSSRSGYQVLLSNGRLEGDLLDQLQELLGRKSPAAADAPATTTATHPPAKADSATPTISAPLPRIPDSALSGRGRTPPSGLGQPATLRTQTEAAEKHEQELAAEARNLEEILNNQSHPDNLAAVKKTGTPVLDGPSADAKSLFAATAGDEFEILDINPDWVHIRISGLSRGWIRRSSLEMPGDSAAAKPAAGSGSAEAEPFRVSSQQFAPFPGDWEPLRGKTVDVVTVQKAAENAANPGPQAKLEYAQALFSKEYASAASTSQGIVLIFDSEDGGMVAATLPALQQWKAGTLSTAAFWHQCFFDPPELLTAPVSTPN